MFANGNLKGIDISSFKKISIVARNFQQTVKHRFIKCEYKIYIEFIKLCKNLIYLFIQDGGKRSTGEINPRAKLRSKTNI